MQNAVSLLCHTRYRGSFCKICNFCHDNLLKKYSYTKGITFSSELDEIINLLNVLSSKQND